MRKALDEGDLGDIATALCDSATPPVGDLDALVPRLADTRQRDAVASLQQARWGHGDATTVRAEVREAFRNGIRWQKAEARQPADILPPLFPRKKP